MHAGSGRRRLSKRTIATSRSGLSQLYDISHIFVGALLALACISDLRTRRIPNALTFSAAAMRARVSPPDRRLERRGLEPRRLLSRRRSSSFRCSRCAAWAPAT